MSDHHIYLAVQRINLGDVNWDALILAMQNKGQYNTGTNPNIINHWRTSLDGTIHIFEAVFESTNVDVDWFINWLSNEFGVATQDIGEVTGYSTHGRFSTFSYPDGVTNRFRVGVFGFVFGQGWPTYEESHAATLQYIADNILEWE